MTDFIHNEVGVFPSDWSIQRVDSLFDIQQGKSVSKAHRKGDNQKSFLRTKNVFWGQFDFSELDQMHFTNEEEARLKLQTGDLLLCEGGDVGRCAIWNAQIGNCYYQNHLHRLRAKFANEIDPKFALYWFWYAFQVANIYIGRSNVTTIPNLSQSKLGELQLPKPRFDEQRRIAHILSTVQTAIEQQERLITLTRELKSVLMHKLFTEGLRGEEQKQTEIGLIPESWTTLQLGNVCLIATGTTPSTNKPDYYRGNIPFIKTSEIANNRICKAETFISEEAVQKYNLKIYQPNTVYMAMYGQGKTRGQVAILDIPTTTSQNTAAIVCGKELVPEYLWQWLMSRYENLRSIGALGHLSHLNLGYVKSYLIALPPIEEQEEVAHILGNFDYKIKLLEEKKNSLSDLFHTLLHQLMTGQIRVDNHEIIDKF